MNWNLISENELPSWMAVANHLLESKVAASSCPCPTCGASLRFFFHRSDSGPRGGLWIWCADCGRHYHSSCLVPEWWNDIPNIDDEQLEDPPDYLQTNWGLITESKALVDS